MPVENRRLQEVDRVAKHHDRLGLDAETRENGDQCHDSESEVGKTDLEAHSGCSVSQPRRLRVAFVKDEVAHEGQHPHHPHRGRRYDGQREL